MNLSLLILAYGYCGFVNNYFRGFQFHWPQINNSILKNRFSLNLSENCCPLLY